MRGPGFFEGVCAGVFAMIVLRVGVQLADRGAFTNLTRGAPPLAGEVRRVAAARCLWSEVSRPLEN
jgi:hypothetical protein